MPSPPEPRGRFAALESLVSPYTGLVHGLVEGLRAPDECRHASYGARLARGSLVLAQEVDEVSGGSARSREQARAAAIAEAAERYSACFVPEERLVLASAAELGAVAVDPHGFALFHERQYAADGFPFVRFDASTVVRWVAGVELGSGRPVLLPAQLVYLPPRLDAGERPIAYSTSSGLAAGWSEAEATLSAVLELVERDAFMIVWSARLSLPLLDVDDDPDLAELDQRLFAPTRLRYAAVDASAFFGIPVAIGVVHGAAGEVGALGVGAACATTVAEAWRKSLAEAFSVHEYVRDDLVEDIGLVPAEPDAISTFDDHVRFYGTGGRAAAAAFLDASPLRRPAREVPAIAGANDDERLAEVVRRLAARGVSAYAVDVTAPDVAESGLRVIRAICPQLCPLDVMYRARFLGGARLYRAACEAGLASRPLELADLNPDPHPFP